MLRGVDMGNFRGLRRVYQAAEARGCQSIRREEPPARSIAAGWIAANPSAFLRDLAFVSALLLNPEPATRRLALDLLGGATLPAAMGAALLDRVIAWALVAPDDDDTTARLRDAAAVLLTAFSGELHALSLDRVALLVGHPNAGVSELGAKALLGVEAPKLTKAEMARRETDGDGFVRFLRELGLLDVKAEHTGAVGAEVDRIFRLERTPAGRAQRLLPFLNTSPLVDEHAFADDETIQRQLIRWTE